MSTPSVPTPHQSKAINRATTSIPLKWVEPASSEEVLPDFLPKVRNENDYFDDLQKAVAGLSALLHSEMSEHEILTKAAMEVKKLETESYDVVREFLGEEVTDQMQRINSDLDELAALVAGTEASLASFSPLTEPAEPLENAGSAASEQAVA